MRSRVWSPPRVWRSWLIEWSVNYVWSFNQIRGRLSTSGLFPSSDGGPCLTADSRLELDFLGPAVFLQEPLDGPLPAELGGDHPAAPAEATAQLIVLEQLG